MKKLNPKLEVIFARRSIRKYQKEPIPKDCILDLLAAGMAAPSACEKDPWEFIVVESKETLAEIASGLPNGPMLKDAAVGIVVCGDLSRAHGNALSYLIQDCSAAIENILLAASILGLGACWLGVHPREERVAHLRKIFQLPDEILPVSVIALGYPAETRRPRTRYKKSKIHWEKW